MVFYGFITRLLISICGLMVNGHMWQDFKSPRCGALHLRSRKYLKGRSQGSRWIREGARRPTHHGDSWNFIWVSAINGRATQADKHLEKNACLRLVSSFCGNYYKIHNRKAPYNYSASIWTYNFSICLCETPKPNISMISGFVESWEPLFMDLDIPKYFKKSENSRNTFLKIICLEMLSSEIQRFANIGKGGTPHVNMI